MTNKSDKFKLTQVVELNSVQCPNGDTLVKTFVNLKLDHEELSSTVQPLMV